MCVRSPQADLTQEHTLTRPTGALICVYIKKTLPLAKRGIVRSSELGISNMPSQYEKKMSYWYLFRIKNPDSIQYQL